jgi:hypothetical protein
MRDMLAIVGPADEDDALIEQLSQGHPGRVTVLVEDAQLAGGDWALDESDSGRALRDRLATLLHKIEARTGAAVVGAVGSVDQLVGWRFDRVVRPQRPVAV